MLVPVRPHAFARIFPPPPHRVGVGQHRGGPGGGHSLGLKRRQGPCAEGRRPGLSGPGSGRAGAPPPGPGEWGKVQQDPGSAVRAPLPPGPGPTGGAAAQRGPGPGAGERLPGRGGQNSPGSCPASTTEKGVQFSPLPIVTALVSSTWVWSGREQGGPTGMGFVSLMKDRPMASSGLKRGQKLKQKFEPRIFFASLG